tara:strand:- start:429 stop:536 length:108 start_codon:yes stop_codon:yes gene_type:complete
MVRFDMSIDMTYLLGLPAGLPCSLSPAGTKSFFPP